MNHVILVGRITDDFEKVEENGSKKVFFTIGIPKPFKNANGIYETDFIRCILWNGIADRACEYCKKGDMIGIRGRITNDCVVAENITFLSSYSFERKEV